MANGLDRGFGQRAEYSGWLYSIESCRFGLFWSGVTTPYTTVENQRGRYDDQGLANRGRDYADSPDYPAQVHGRRRRLRWVRRRRASGGDFLLTLEYRMKVAP